MNTIKQRIATPRISTGAELHAELLDSGRSGVRVEMKLPVVRLRGEMLVDFDNCGEVEISTVQDGIDDGKIVLGAWHFDALITALQSVRSRVVVTSEEMHDVHDIAPLVAAGDV